MSSRTFGLCVQRPPKRSRPALACTVTGLLFTWLTGCNGVDAPFDKAESVAVLSSAEPRRLKPSAETDLAIQAQNADGDGVDNARIFFLISEPSVLHFVGRSDTDLVQERTKEQEAAGIKAHGIARVTVAAAEVSTETTVRVLVGLASPSETTPESGVASIELVVEPPEIPSDEGDAGGNAL